MVHCFAGEAVGYSGVRQHYFYKAIASTIHLGQFRHLLHAGGEEQFWLLS